MIVKEMLKSQAKTRSLKSKSQKDQENSRNKEKILSEREKILSESEKILLLSFCESKGITKLHIFSTIYISSYRSGRGAKARENSNKIP